MIIQKYLKEVTQEIKKVSWPSKEQTINKTGLVIGVSLIVALYLAGLDLVFQKIVAAIL